MRFSLRGLKSKISKHIKKLPISSLYWKNLKPVFVWEYTKTGKSMLRPAFDQSNCKKAGPALILIERHLIKQFISKTLCYSHSLPSSKVFKCIKLSITLSKLHDDKLIQDQIQSCQVVYVYCLETWYLISFVCVELSAKGYSKQIRRERGVFTSTFTCVWILTQLCAWVLLNSGWLFFFRIQMEVCKERLWHKVLLQKKDVNWSNNNVSSKQTLFPKILEKCGLTLYQMVRDTLK